MASIHPTLLESTGQPQSPYSSYDAAEDTRKSSWSAPRHEQASAVERSPMPPSLLRNSSHTEFSSLQPINNRYSTYSSEYPGGESKDQSNENAERFRLLPPILGHEKKSSRPTSTYSDNDQRIPPQHHRPRSSPMIEASSSNRDQKFQNPPISTA
ncbi:hypothetical protein BC943DRAFT_150850 [Umbelopsis sp. AD052]|nr:hypothetical protein BC943DRAFT_150850 [Umbelopsis sp. AD052]